MNEGLANQEVRRAAEVAKVKLWEVAFAMGVSDNTLTRRLRFELPEDEKQRYLDTIQRLKEKGGK